MRPKVIIKAALTLDGQIAAADGSSRWISSVTAREDAHLLRAEVDAVMVGAGTVLADDPELTVRLGGFQGVQPRPVVVAGSRPLPPESKVLKRDPIIFSPRPRSLPGTVVTVPDSTGIGVDLGLALEALPEHGIKRLLVEGGSQLITSLVVTGLVDSAVFYFAAKLAVGVGQPLFTGVWETIQTSRPVEITSVKQVDDGFRVDFELPPSTFTHY